MRVAIVALSGGGGAGEEEREKEEGERVGSCPYITGCGRKSWLGQSSRWIGTAGRFMMSRRPLGSINCGTIVAPRSRDCPREIVRSRSSVVWSELLSMFGDGSNCIFLSRLHTSKIRFVRLQSASRQGFWSTALLSTTIHPSTSFFCSAMHEVWCLHTSVPHM